MAPLVTSSGSLWTDDFEIGLEGLEFFELIHNYLPVAKRNRIREAFDLAKRVHGDQRRKSGEPFFIHPLTVAYFMAMFKLDAPALIAALLHDVAEDTYVSLEEIEEEFGKEVRHLVDGVTKLKEVSAEFSQERELSPEEIRDASLHKMFEAMTGDVRVVLVKLFDRYHNMLTIGAMPPKKQEEKARETLYVYAPLANRLGIWWLKSELEALSFQVLDSVVFEKISQDVKNLVHQRQAIYSQVSEQLIDLLVQKELRVDDVRPSDHSISSIYQALIENEKTEITDKIDFPLRLTVLLEDLPACYLALGYVHNRWKPVPGQFDDYIAVPRENLYRALHTTVIHSSGLPLKIRFRSAAMHEVSEIGVLARWVYAEDPLWFQGVSDQVDALMHEINKSINLDAETFSSAVKGVVEDVFSRQITVYTPNGDVVELPKGATAIDFAYAIHSAIGNQCQNAYVNDELYPLNKPLNDGDRVRITKSGWGRVQRTWLEEDLGFLKTSRAKSQVRRWFRRISDEQALKEGQDLLDGELQLIGMGTYSHSKAAKLFGFDDSEKLYYALGRAEILPTAVSENVLEIDWNKEPIRNVGHTVRTEEGEEYTILNTAEKDLRLCKSCKPRPGDTILGFRRSKGGLTIHKEGCYSLRPDPQTKNQVKLRWGRDGAYPVHKFTIQVDVYDRSGLIYELSELLNSEAINISTINTPAGNENGRLHVVMTIEVANPSQLVRVLHRAQTLVNVYQIQCLPSQANGLVTASFDYLPEKNLTDRVETL